MNQDFAVLYAELELDPGCSLDELRHAYRRRISELHPDRNGGEPADGGGQAVLGDLTALYANAVRFERQYGRLPGSTMAHVAPASTRNERTFRALVVPPRKTDPAAGRRRATTLAVLTVLLLLLWMAVAE